MQSNPHPLLQEILIQLKNLNACNKEFLSFSQACDYLDLSPSFLYKMTSQRRIAFYVPNGKKIYFRKLELDNWLSKNKNESIENITSDINDVLKKK